MLAMIFGINIFLKSGLIDILFNLIKPIKIIPVEVFPMILLRPISGLIGSVIQGSTDTTFYVLTLYFGSIGIKKIKYSMIAGLFADLIGIIFAIIVVRLLF